MLAAYWAGSRERGREARTTCTPQGFSDLLGRTSAACSWLHALSSHSCGRSESESRGQEEGRKCFSRLEASVRAESCLWNRWLKSEWRLKLVTRVCPHRAPKQGGMLGSGGPSLRVRPGIWRMWKEHFRRSSLQSVRPLHAVLGVQADWKALNVLPQ